MYDRRIVVSLAVLFLMSVSVFGQETTESTGKVAEPQKAEKKGQQLIEEAEKTAAYPVSTSCYVSDGGHRWNINASNTANRNYSCSSRCYLKTSTGYNTVATCSYTVPAKANNVRVCTVFDNRTVWTVTNPGSFSCNW
jgi:hypothetical protein